MEPLKMGRLFVLWMFQAEAGVHMAQPKIYILLILTDFLIQTNLEKIDGYLLLLMKIIKEQTKLDFTKNKPLLSKRYNNTRFVLQTSSLLL